VPAAGKITSLLRKVKSGDQSASHRLCEIAYPELRRIAETHFRNERLGHLLQPTALVNEVWLKFMSLNAVRLQDRVHFFSLCSRMMRRILVDHARSRSVRDRDVSLTTNGDSLGAIALDLDRALRILEQAQPRAAQVVELRYFGGLSNEEIARHLEISPATVKRDWLAARAWLYGRLHGTAA
jgi:RNA polymerase sigma factor (TIGR02999 family)